MRKAAKVDLNQSEIVKALRQMGCTVQDLSSVGSGCPDILVGISGHNVLMEIKNPDTRGKLTIDQVLWHDEWRGQVQIVKSVEHAVRIVNYYRQQASAVKAP